MKFFIYFSLLISSLANACDILDIKQSNSKKFNISYQIPQMTSDESFARKFNKKMNKLYDVKGLENELIGDYNKTKEDFLNPENFTFTSKINNIYCNDRFLSFEINEISDMGEAQPDYAITTYNYNLKTKKKMKFRNLFKQLSKQELANLIHQKLIEKYPHELFKEVYESRFDKQMIDDVNFLVRDGKVEVIFNVYEVAPFEMGEIRFELATILNTTSK